MARQRQSTFTNPPLVIPTIYNGKNKIVFFAASKYYLQENTSESTTASTAANHVSPAGGAVVQQRRSIPGPLRACSGEASSNARAIWRTPKSS